MILTSNSKEVSVPGRVYYGHKTLHRIYASTKECKSKHEEVLKSLDKLIQTVPLTPHPNSNLQLNNLTGTILVPLIQLRRDVAYPPTIPGQNLTIISPRSQNWNEYQDLLYKLRPSIHAIASCLRMFD